MKTIEILKEKIEEIDENYKDIIYSSNFGEYPDEEGPLSDLKSISSKNVVDRIIFLDKDYSKYTKEIKNVYDIYDLINVLEKDNKNIEMYYLEKYFYFLDDSNILYFTKFKEVYEFFKTISDEIEMSEIEQLLKHESEYYIKMSEPREW